MKNMFNLKDIISSIADVGQKLFKKKELKKNDLETILSLCDDLISNKGAAFGITVARDVPATVTPIDVAIIIKYIGKDLLNADSASGDIFPAKKVSTTLYRVWNKVPTIAGTASFLTSFGILPFNKSIFKILFGIYVFFQVFLQHLFAFVSF